MTPCDWMTLMGGDSVPALLMDLIVLVGAWHVGKFLLAVLGECWSGLMDWVEQQWFEQRDPERGR